MQRSDDSRLGKGPIAKIYVRFTKFGWMKIFAGALAKSLEHRKSNQALSKAGFVVSFVMLASLVLVRSADSRGGPPSVSTPRPNILFIVMDDVGIDQLASFGFSQPTVPAATPNLDAIASSGIKFTNVWVMPECSPSRAAFFTGRYPLRTGVTSALFNNMLPASQTSPYETTLPRVLATAGYKSAMVGKFHLGDQNPAGDCALQTLGFGYFDGNLGASPGAIDTQAGNTSVPAATYSCGFDQSGSAGACYQDDGACGLFPDGKTCLESGGPVPHG
jgi:Sulfatase